MTYRLPGFSKVKFREKYDLIFVVQEITITPAYANLPKKNNLIVDMG